METKIIFATLAVFFATISMSFAYTTQIHAPAVLQNEDLGTLTTIQLNLTAGNGSVKILGPQTVGSSTIESARSAVQAATSYLDANAMHYNFTYYIENSVNVSGPSGGLALTLLAVYALRNQSIYNNFTVTGTISPNGSVGEIGGVTDKSQAAEQNGMNFILVPMAPQGSSEEFLYYISQQLYGIPVIEVSNLTQAVGYANAQASQRPAIVPLSFNITQEYNTSVNPAQLQCSDCNSSYFIPLVNETFSLVNSTISAVPSEFSSAKAQMSSNMQQYAAIASKGYTYTAADMAFNEYIDAYTLAHSNSFTKTSAMSLASNVSDYCALVSPSQLTNTNYEYIAGGELRQSLASANLQEAISLINNSQSTDDIVSAVSMIAESQAWCNAASDMYGIASGIGGTPVYETKAMQTAAQQMLHSASQYSGLYLSAALISYNDSEYSAALYGAEYAKSFGSALPSNITNASEQSYIANLARNSTSGIWPLVFSNSAMFYLQQAADSTANTTLSQSYTASAYTLAYLANGLSKINGYISANLAPGSSTAASGASSSQLTAAVSEQSLQINALENDVGMLQGAIEYLLVVMVVLLVVVLVILANTWRIIKLNKQHQPQHQRRSR